MHLNLVKLISKFCNKEREREWEQQQSKYDRIELSEPKQQKQENRE